MLYSNVLLIRYIKPGRTRTLAINQPVWTFGQVMTLTFDLLTSESNQFIRL